MQVSPNEFRVLHEDATAYASTVIANASMTESEFTARKKKVEVKFAQAMQTRAEGAQISELFGCKNESSDGSQRARQR